MRFEVGARGMMQAAVLAAAAMSAGCHRADKHVNPIANVDSKQPDKVLFDRGMDALAHHRYDVARITLQTLINTYPDSEFVARAKLGVADSWYREGGTAALQQAEVEYKDFETFFPNMPEAAEAQMKVAGIHYRQMEKSDRDPTQAKRAEDEYRELIQQFPDSKLVPEAKQRLREVQEVLARKEFDVGKFYYLRQAYAAAQARLRSVVEAYPLFSDIDETLYTLGQSYEAQMSMLRGQDKFPEAAKARLIADLRQKAEDAYGKILTRYPEMPRADDARSRLEALGLPVPKATPEAIAQNKAEMQGREELGRFGRIMSGIHKHPEVTMAAKTGEPSLTDTKEVAATDVVREYTRTATGAAEPGKTGVQVVKPGDEKSQAPPRSDNAAPTSGTSDAGSGSNAQPALVNPPETNAAPSGTSTQVNDAAPAADAPKNDAGQSAIPELKPTESNPPAQGSDTGAAAGTPGANGTPGAATTATTPATTSGTGATTAGADAKAASATQTAPQTTSQESSSKKKKKKKKKDGNQ